MKEKCKEDFSMKQFLSLLLAVSLVLGCMVLSAAAQEAPFRFTRENFPRIDGSTSLVPLGQGIASVLLGESREEAADLIAFNRTTQSFRNLYWGDCDIVIAAEPKADVFDEMAKQGFPYQMETIAKEALVFVVNESNPVNSLTAQQLRGIYSGEITNWSQVGGEDLPIVAFQRNPTAGSQVMMEKLVMEDTPMMEAPSTQVPTEMEGLIEAVRGYDNSANAIGYTVFYYATDMQMATGLKILSVDGVLPEADSIRSGAYPYVNGYYCCISANEPEDSPARRLYRWLVSDAGQRLLNLEGYVAVSAPGEAETDGSDIHTDYSRYAPNGGTPAVFTRFDCAHDRLERSDRYGNLYPYKGGDLYATKGSFYGDYAPGMLLGLYNHQGQLVTDPVFTVCRMLRFEPSGGHGWFLALNPKEGCIASADGSFVSDYVYENAYTMGEYIYAVRSFNPLTYDLYDNRYQIVKTQDDFLLDGYPVNPQQIFPDWLIGQVVIPNGESYPFVLMDMEGNVLMKANYLQAYEDGSIEVQDDNWVTTVFDADLQPILFDGLQNPTWAYRVSPGFYEVSIDGENTIITDTQGNLFAWDVDFTYGTANGGFAVTQGKHVTFFDARGRVLLENVSNKWHYVCQNIFEESTDDGLILHKLPEDKTLFIPEGSGAWACGNAICVYFAGSDGSNQCCIVDTDLNLLPGVFPNLYSLQDNFTGTFYLCAADSYGFSGESRLIDAYSNQELFRANGQVAVQDGFFTVTDDWAFSCYNPQGNLIFCYPNYGLGSGD